MSSQFVVDKLTESAIDLSTTALLDDRTADDLEHDIFDYYKNDPVLPKITNNARRLFPTYLEHEQPAALSPEARAAISGILFGLFISNLLPVDKDASKYLLAQDLESMRDKDSFLTIGTSCIIEVEFVPELIPKIDFLQSDDQDFDLELWAGFGLVASTCLEAYDLEHNYF